MRAGWVVSFIGHIGFVLMTLLAWETRSELAPSAGSVVPVEIVDIAAESNVRALAEDVPEDEAETRADAEPNDTSRPESAEAEQLTHLTPEEEQHRFLAGLTDLGGEPRPRLTEGEPAPESRPGAGLGTSERVAMEDRLRALARAHIARNNCWRMPSDLPDPERLVVTVQFDLNRNGTLNGQPRVISPRNTTFDNDMRVAVDYARRAILTCDPFPFADDPMVGEHYELWREMEYTFRPRL
jgi:hypothetical protein